LLGPRLLSYLSSAGVTVPRALDKVSTATLTSFHSNLPLTS
jgi:hypothetical protein